MMAKQKIIEERSAGGVVYRQNDQGMEVCLIQPKGTVRWQLPKGHIETDEDSSTAALREAEEETGLVGKIGSFIDTIDYTFFDRYSTPGPHLVHKQVSFYLVEATGGSLREADGREIQRAQWVNAEEALDKLSFENERKVLAKGLQILVPSTTP